MFKRVSKTINLLQELQNKLSGAPLVRSHVMLQLCLYDGFLSETFEIQNWAGG